MQGDLAPSLSGGPSIDAGMIPRVLSKLFQHLEKNFVDYSVKVSYVELYNEELRDLFASESTTNTTYGSNTVPGLKIFDDSAKRGVLIQGLEEAPVKDAADAINWLRKGSHKRQVAATKFNDHSRSVFTQSTTMFYLKGYSLSVVRIPSSLSPFTPRNRLLETTFSALAN
jgi:kinesin family member 11